MALNRMGDVIGYIALLLSCGFFTQGFPPPLWCVPREILRSVLPSVIGEKR